MIYLGKCLERCGQMVQMEDNIYRAVTPACTHALAIKNSFAKRIFQDLDKCYKYPDSVLNCDYFNRGIDSIYNNYIMNGIAKGLVFHPSIFFQDVITGGSDLRLEYMINYQECKDTMPSCDQETSPATNQKERRNNTPFVITIIVLIIIIMVLLVVWHRRRVKTIIMHPITRWTGFGLVILIILIIAIVLCLKFSRSKQNDERPEWAKGFTKPPTEILHTLTDYSSNVPKHFLSDSKMMATKEYRTFNPNGILVMASQIESPENSDDSWARDRKSHLALLTTSRCSNDKVSYPLVQIFDSKITNPKFSKMVLVESHRSIKSNHLLGYEDMRVFKYQEDYYLIGVNLDRHPKTLPGMVLVKLDEQFNSSSTWHLKFPPLTNVPNKNWSPLTLPDGELGLIVDIDPLLIVRRTKKISKRSGKEKYAETCEVAYAVEKQTAVEKVRNSTVTFDWNTLSINTQDAYLS